jgi:hypothetical protein
MTLRVVRFLALLCVALTLGLAFAHVLEIPGKLRLPGEVWLTVQQNLYVAFGPPLGAGIEVAAIALTWLAAVLGRRRRRPAFALSVAAGTAVTLGLASWGLVVAPANTVLSAWTAATLPPDWAAVRFRWELGHALHAACLAVGFSALLGAILAETPD